MNKEKDAVGALIRQIMNIEKVSVKELSKKLNVSDTNLHNKLGRQTMKYSDVVLILNQLGYSIKWIKKDISQQQQEEVKEEDNNNQKIDHPHHSYTGNTLELYNELFSNPMENSNGDTDVAKAKKNQKKKQTSSFSTDNAICDGEEYEDF